ncbi:MULTISPECIES: hypothetical protein [Actinosynnema]|uniref:hypothetical protein n=1 Tax=Actinosynnema TaxID=40566 RepID=UPI0020A51AFF|nr:hypothetical protein [Actinosynnema pretiosum]MCP2094507.1 hypothetical protein [Actinosynnema pretiosum]
MAGLCAGYLVLLLGVTTVAPSLATGVHRVDAPQFSIAGADVGCGSPSRCEIPLESGTLVVHAPMTVPRAAWAGACSASFQGREIGCRRVVQYGPAAPWVQVGDLGVPEEEARRLRGEFPWWADVVDYNGFLVMMLLAPAGFAVAAGAVAGSGERRQGVREVKALGAFGVTFMGLWVVGLLVSAVAGFPD